MKKIGISLIVLVITIVVIIILSGAIILSLNNSNVIENTNEAKLKSDLSSFQEIFSIYITNMYGEKLGNFDPSKFNANEMGMFYDGKTIEGKNINDIFQEGLDKYNGKITIEKGKIVYYSENEKELEWAKDIGTNINIFTIKEGVLSSTNAALSLIGNDGILVIPDNVRKIESGAFNNVSNLVSVVIPGTVKTIEGNVFSNNSTLQSVTLENGVETLGEYAFRNCTNLKKIIMPDSIKRIGSYTFSNCRNLTEIKISKGLKDLPYASFSYCHSLKKVDIPEGIVSFGTDVFNNCTALEEIKLPSTINSININCFINCGSIKNINIAPGNKKFSFENDTLYSDNKTKIIMMFKNSNLIQNNTINIPENIISILSGSFNFCRAYESIYISENLIELNINELPNLKTIDINPNNPSYVFEDGILYTKNKKNIIKSYDKNTTINVKSGVEVINGNAFSGNINLQTITFPESVREIGRWAFSGCNNMEKLVLGPNIQYLDFLFLNGCQVKNIEIDENNKNYIVIDNFILSKDKKNMLTTFGNIEIANIPEGVETIGVYAMYGTIIKEVKFPSTLKTICTSAISFSRITSLEIPSNVVTIYYGAFSNCPNLKSVKINKAKDSILYAPWGLDYGNRAVEWIGN